MRYFVRVIAIGLTITIAGLPSAGVFAQFDGGGLNDPQGEEQQNQGFEGDNLNEPEATTTQSTTQDTEGQQQDTTDPDDDAGGLREPSGSGSNQDRINNTWFDVNDEAEFEIGANYQITDQFNAPLAGNGTSVTVESVPVPTPSAISMGIALIGLASLVRSRR